MYLGVPNRGPAGGTGAVTGTRSGTGECMTTSLITADEEKRMATRRQFLKLATAVGVGGYLTTKLGFWQRVFAQVPGGTLSPNRIPKFVAPLLVPPAMPAAASDATADYYTIAVRQFTQQVLPASLPATTVWSY